MAIRQLQGKGIGRYSLSGDTLTYRASVQSDKVSMGRGLGPTRISTEPSYWAGLIALRELRAEAIKQPFIQLSCAFFAVSVETV